MYMYMYYNVYPNEWPVLHSINKSTPFLKKKLLYP